MSSKAKRTKTQRDPAIRVDASADESIDSGTSSSINSHLNTRQEEKNYLQHLNNRLSIYIEKVRSLENENARLQVQIREVEVVERKEKENLSTRYEMKIEELRKQIDYLTREKAKLQIENDKASSGYEELKARAPKLEKDLKKAEKDRNIAQAQVQDLTAQFNNSDAARIQAEQENEQFKRELSNAENQVDLLRRQLEDEVLIRTELENRFQTTKEDLEFARRSHNNHIEEMRRKRQVEMTSFSDEVQHKYEAKLQEQLQAVRNDFDKRMADQRAEVDEFYRTKLAELQNNAGRQRDLAARAREESSMLKIRVQDLEHSNKDNQILADRLTHRVKELEAMLRHAHEDAELRLQQRDEQIAQLQKEIADLIHDYQDLSELKVKLDTELNMYHQMLEQEETRLRISPTGSPNTTEANLSQNLSESQQPVARSTPLLTSTIHESTRRGVKRRRLNQEDTVSFDHQTKSWKSNSHAEGDISIEEVDTDGSFIRLANKGEEDISISAWILKSVGGEKEVSFKFHSRQTIKAGKSLTIWSNDSGQDHQPPSNIVMKNQSWPKDDAIRTELLNADRDIVAWREAFLSHSFHSVEEGSDADKNCIIM